MGIGSAGYERFKREFFGIGRAKTQAGLLPNICKLAAKFQNSSMIQHTWLWVCSYTLVTRSESGFVDGFVLDAVSGEPIAGAEVSQIIHSTYHSYQFGYQIRTDKNGYFKFDYGKDRCLLFIKNGNEELLQSDDDYRSLPYTRGPDDAVVFFTDRSLYRPGQTIYFKGIYRHANKDRNIYEVIPNHYVVIHFLDVNGQDIAKETYRTNDFGSFSGQFTAPADRLNGNMSLVSESPAGHATIRIEE